jgi:glycosyltransferase involved in cell wall biosynthesis
VDRSLKILAKAIGQGAAIEFDIIGDGAERIKLETIVKSEGLETSVRFIGSLPYGSMLMKRLSQYDGLLFTPTAEDTPRMIFDGYAAGLPLVAFDIGYVRERLEQEHAAFLLPRDQIEQSAVCLSGLCRNRGQIAGLSRSARVAAQYHAAENWYRRRAEWTIEAVEQHGRAKRGASVGKAA